MFTKLANLWEESRRIGLDAFQYRVRAELSRRLGLDARRRPVREFTPERWLQGAPDGMLRRPEEFYAWWRARGGRLFVPEIRDLADFYHERLSAEDREAIADRGVKAARGTILAFRGWEADFGHPPRWSLNPVTKARWPADRHSKTVYSGRIRQGCGDIKYTWEIGRFLHAADVLRAYALTGDRRLVDDLFVQIESFAAENPLYQGPHWISEQEAAVRACMLALVLETLRPTDCLDGRRVVTLLVQLAASAEFCMKEAELARRCIANNHLIAAALGLYLAARVMPWHRRAGRWRDCGRTLVRESLRTQWWPDGGYLQSSHNYHRLALSYLVWVLRLAELGGDGPLAAAIRARLAPAFVLLNSMIDESSGRLPNWGANDGALFCPWTSCDYADFRPLVTSLTFALDGTRQYDAGPWDEQLLWFWGPESLQARAVHRRPADGSFPQQGLHCIRQAQSVAVLRSGPILSRYGHQADQLHVDLWWKGQNVLLDAGSYSYADPEAHAWFQSTRAHNTVVVAGQSQMVPYRQFLFLGWPQAGTFSAPSHPAVRRWLGGWHDGYCRLPKRIVHGRLLLEMGEGCWLVIDLLAAKHASPSASVDVCWHLPEAPYSTADKCLQLELEEGRFAMAWAGLEGGTIRVESACPDRPDGWHSRYYGRKGPALSVHLEGRLEDKLLVATWLGPAELRPVLRCDPGGEQVTCGDLSLSMNSCFDELRRRCR